MDASSPPALRPNRPLSVKEITENAMAFDFNTNIHFRTWARAAETLWQEVIQGVYPTIEVAELTIAI